MTSADKLTRKLIDWNFIASLEGDSILKGYIPGNKRSGVTIATGVDIGQMSNLEPYRAAGASNDLLARLQPYLGLKGDAAFVVLAKRPLIITKEEAELLDDVAFSQNIGPYEEYYNRATVAKNPTNVCLAKLEMPLSTVIASLTWNFGPLWGRKCPEMNLWCISQDWANAALELYHWYGFGKTDEMLKEGPKAGSVVRGLIKRRRREAMLIADHIGMDEEFMKVTDAKKANIFGDASWKNKNESAKAIRAFRPAPLKDSVWDK